MSIAKFLVSKANMVIIQKIIANLNNKFNSHEFIEKFSKEFESDYIDFLTLYKSKNAFLSVHKQIAKFLSINSATLRIRKTRKVSSRNIFGEMDNIQEWIK